MSKEKDEVGSKRRDKIRGHIPGGVIKQIFDTDNPAEEAANVAGVTSALGDSLSKWAYRMQRRMAHGIRYMKAAEDTLSYAREAFGQVAEEALLDDETEEMVATVAGTDATIKGLHPEHEPS